MTKGPVKDVGASLRARLLHIARERGEDFQLVLTRYANERLLFRLATSQHAQNFAIQAEGREITCETRPASPCLRASICSLSLSTRLGSPGARAAGGSS